MKRIEAHKLTLKYIYNTRTRIQTRTGILSIIHIQHSNIDIIDEFNRFKRLFDNLSLWQIKRNSNSSQCRQNQKKENKQIKCKKKNQEIQTNACQMLNVQRTRTRLVMNGLELGMKTTHLFHTQNFRCNFENHHFHSILIDNNIY